MQYLSIIVWKGEITLNVCRCIVCPLLLKKGGITLSICRCIICPLLLEKGAITLNICQCIICPLLLEKGELPWTFVGVLSVHYCFKNGELPSTFAHIFKSSVLFSLLCMLWSCLRMLTVSFVWDEKTKKCMSVRCRCFYHHAFRFVRIIMCYIIMHSLC